MADFDIESARKEGYTDDEISKYLAKSRGFDLAGALKEGYTNSDILKHLENKQPPISYTQKPEGISGGLPGSPELKRPFVPGLDVIPEEGIKIPYKLPGTKKTRMRGGRPMMVTLSEPTLPGVVPGIGKAVKGVEAFTRPGRSEKTKAATQILEGLGEAVAVPALGMLPIAAIAAPGATALGLTGGLAGGAIGGFGTQAALKAMGTSPETAELGGEIAGITGGALGGFGGVALSKAIFPPLTSINAITRAFKIGPKGVTKFQKGLDTVFEDIKAVTPKDVFIQNKADLSTAINEAQKFNRQQFDSFLQPYTKLKATVDTSPVADAMIRSIPEKLRLENPEAYRNLVYRADTTYRRQMPVDKVYDFLKTANAQLDAFYDKNPTAKALLSRSSFEAASGNAEVNSLRNVLYNKISANVPEIVRDLQIRYGNMENFRRHFENQRARDLVTLSKTDPGLTGMAAGLTRRLRNPLETAAQLMARQPTTTDGLIEMAFREYKGPAAASTFAPEFQQPPGYAQQVFRGPTGLALPPGSPPPAQLRPPAPGQPATYRFPSSTGVPLPPGGPPASQLPPATTIFQTGTVPKALPSPGPERGFSPTPPGPSQFTQARGFVVLNTAPIKDPTTGKIEYVTEYVLAQMNAERAKIGLKPISPLSPFPNVTSRYPFPPIPER